MIVFVIFLGKFLDKLDNNDISALESFKHIAASIGFILLIYLGYSYSVKIIIKENLLTYKN